MNPHFGSVANLGRLITALGVCFLMSNSPAQEKKKPPPVIPPEFLPAKHFDVVETSHDLNGFPLNPKWGQQFRDGSQPSAVESCPLGSRDPAEWLSARWPDCTSFPVFFNRWDFGVIGVCHHVNFKAVTYEGTVWWNGTGRTALDLPNWPFGDYDYTFNLSRDDHALYIKGYDALHIEFDARETVNEWDRDRRTWWELFHHTGVDRGDYQAQRMIDGRLAIVIGLLGLDAPHSGKPELHPVYAMVVRVNERWLPSEKKVKETSWAFFVRNWGNEGYCGYDQMDLDTQVIKVQIPPPAAAMEYSIRKGARSADDLSSMGVTAEPNRDGMLLTFTLLRPESQSWFMGDLTFRGPAPIIARESAEAIAPKGLPRRISKEPEEKIPLQLEALRAQIEKLPASARKELTVQLERSTPRRKGRQEVGRVVISKPTQVSATPPKSARVVDHTSLLRPKKDAEAELEQRTKLEVIRRFFAARGIRVDLPSEK